jgi:hypothetical protein
MGTDLVVGIQQFKHQDLEMLNPNRPENTKTS